MAELLVLFSDRFAGAAAWVSWYIRRTRSIAVCLSGFHAGSYDFRPWHSDKVRAVMGDLSAFPLS